MIAAPDMRLQPIPTVVAEVPTYQGAYVFTAVYSEDASLIDDADRRSLTSLSTCGLAT